MKKDEGFSEQPSDEFNVHVSKLLNLLKRILRNNKMSQDDVKKIFGEFKASKENVNLNLFFLTFMPMNADELDDIGNEFEEIFDEEWDREDHQEELRFEISDHDEEFLKKHGIKF